MSSPSALELQMLDLINAERAAEGLNPLVMNTALNQSSENHTEWMIENQVFSHTGEGGSSSRARMEDAGYPISGSWRTRENIAWEPSNGDGDYSDEVIRLHENLMMSPGHRANILDPNVEEIGIGIVSGDFTDDGDPEAPSLLVTQNFARTGADTSDQQIMRDTSAAPVEADQTVGIAAPAATVGGVSDEPDAPPVIVESISDPASAADMAVPVGMSDDFSDIFARFGMTAPAFLSSDRQDDGTDETMSMSARETVTSTTGTTVSRVEGSAVADTEDGSSVSIDGTGNAEGQVAAATETSSAMETFESGTAAPVDPMPASQPMVSVSEVAAEPEGAEPEMPAMLVPGFGTMMSAGGMTFDLGEFIRFPENATVQTGSSTSSAMADTVIGPDGSISIMSGVVGNAAVGTEAASQTDMQSERLSSGTFEIEDFASRFNTTSFDSFLL